jgi:hypothetical protein
LLCSFLLSCHIILLRSKYPSQRPVLNGRSITKLFYWLSITENSYWSQKFR